MIKFGDYELDIRLFPYPSEFNKYFYFYDSRKGDPGLQFLVKKESAQSTNRNARLSKLRKTTFDPNLLQPTAVLSKEKHELFTMVSKFQNYYNRDLPLCSAEIYLDWKILMHNLFNDPITGLTSGWKIDLTNLADSTYVIGSAARCYNPVPRSDVGCPSCPDILGTITIPESGHGAAFFHVQKDLHNGGKTFELVRQFELQLTDEIYIWVNDYYFLSVHDIKRTAYSSVFNRRDIFLPFDSTLIYGAQLIGKTELSVDGFEDLTFRVFYNSISNIWQVFYHDPITAKQRIYPYRGVDLHPIGGNKFMLNFNFSYPRYVSPQYEDYINILTTEILAGVVYNLF
ncbi:hypothetical protein HK103_007072 [Boothiomyces macroporosus]|uniref:Uncharacterized protein n=1 Tax=Boothiomyces macroporosus TaxID=261099 RepID=A0AAD5Y253_9FUNG|nr:hypothetical protein HK103_007072 [Boothiomyces macroporosus]